MPQLPEQIRPAVAVIAKYHFWILAALVPLLLLPLLMLGTGSLDAKIAAQKSQIDGKVQGLTQVLGTAEHPNDAWSTAVTAQTGKIRDETLVEWEKFWQDQQSLRVWPGKLGDDFVKAVASLKPGGQLKKDYLQRYQNNVPELVRELPARMGADDLMLEGSVPGGGGDGGPGARGAPPGFGGRPGAGGEFGFGTRPGAGGQPSDTSTALVQWSSTDQKRIYDSFKWDKTPSTTQVRLAQEELWVYGLFCDAIRKLNAGAAGAFNAPISEVNELAVGYFAAEDQPGGQGTNRVERPAAAAPGGGGEFGAEAAAAPGTFGSGLPGEGAPAGRPVNPRFVAGGDAAGPGRGGPGSEFGGEGAAPAAPTVAPDEQLKEWIYVDFSGKPLTAAELATVPSAKMVHLMPFTLRLMIDQRKLDALLAELAANSVPIDVRQVRINPSQQAGGGPGRGEFAAPAAASGGSGNVFRPFDVIVELRGTVGLAPPPDRSVIDTDQVAAAGGGA